MSKQTCFCTRELGEIFPFPPTLTQGDFPFQPGLTPLDVAQPRRPYTTIGGAMFPFLVRGLAIVLEKLVGDERAFCWDGEGVCKLGLLTGFQSRDQSSQNQNTNGWEALLPLP